MGERCRGAHRWLLAWAAVMGFLLLAPAAQAELTVTTGPATSVTKTTATLNGVIDTDDLLSAWSFQYGTVAVDQENTGYNPIGSGVRAISQTITGLTPGTTYRFRLVVAQLTATPPNVSYGNEVTLTTLPAGPGSLSLRSHRVTVHRGVATVPLACTGPSASRCEGTLILTGHVSASTGSRSIVCARHAFALSFGTHPDLKISLSHGCSSALEHSASHRLHVSVKTVPAGEGQTPLRAAVTLAGS